MSAFGFLPHPLSPAPDPRAVGQALAAQRVPAPTAAPGMPGPGGAAGGLPEASVGDPLEHALRLLGARHTGGVGQTGTGSASPGMPDSPVDETVHHSAYNAAIGEAMTRMGGGLMRNPTRLPERQLARQRQLLALGVTPFEVELLARTT